MIEASVAESEGMPLAGFEPLLAAQVAAVLLIREGGSMDKLKLVKLLYLVEREAVKRFRRPMFFDQNFSLPNGPAGTNALSGIDGKHRPDVWGRYMSVEGKRVRVSDTLVEDDFDDLSDAHLDVVEAVSREFRGRSAADLWRHTHDRRHVPEYVQIAEGRQPIADETLASWLGFEDPRGYADHVAELRGMERGRLA